MNKEEFLKEIENILQSDNQLSFNTELSEIEEWDSLSRMTLMVFLQNNFNIKVTLSELQELKTVNDIAQKAGLC